MTWPSTRYKTAAPGGTWTPDDFNGWQDQFIRPDGLVGDDMGGLLAGQLAINQTGVARRAYDEQLDEQTMPGVRLPEVTLGTTGQLYMLFYELEVERAGSESSFAVQVRDATGNQMFENTFPVYSSGYRYAAPGSFLLTSALPSGNTFRLSIAGLAGSYRVRNAKLWALAYSF